ncbi:MAG: GAF domain-containing sensor histidine kinase [Pseudomonadota bacterium]
MWKKSEELVKAILKEDWAKGLPVKGDFWDHVVQWVEETFLPEVLSLFVHKVDEIIEINPELSEREILAVATRHMVEFLGAQSASVRIFDPHTEQLLSYGSYPPHEEYRETFIPLEGSVAGEVIKTRRTYLVPNLLDEKLYQHKGIIKRKETKSLMAVLLEIPRFYPHERDTVGVIQIYYAEKNRTFTPLEVQFAEVMSKRLTFVIARKKILSLHMINEKKEAIVRKIFLKLGSREGVKMKDVFNRVIPELADIINVGSCALFSVADDYENVILEAGYPETVGYHGIGKKFSIQSEPAFEIVLSKRNYLNDSPYEMVTPSYVLVMDPHRSTIVSNNVKNFALAHNINSILYIPLYVGDEITHFMTFDALDQRKTYMEEEIEIFLFLGRELMKAQRIERLDDILHDFKNPAIATAGFARRLKHLLEDKDINKNDDRIKRYVDILLEETSRLQEMAFSLYQVGKDLSVNLTEVLKKRFQINEEAIKEQLKQNVIPHKGPFQEPLYVRCYPLHLERILDNLLNNATNAIPPHGGTLAIRTYIDGEWACAEISNTGIIAEEERLRLLEGEGQGRGLYITHRIIRLLRGKIEIIVGKETTTLLVKLPLLKNS